jgi:hypothetical protein
VDTPRPSHRTNRTRRVPHTVLTGDRASLERGGGGAREEAREEPLEKRVDDEREDEGDEACSRAQA